VYHVVVDPRGSLRCWVEMLPHLRRLIGVRGLRDRE
jgi:hypothetical protein